MSQIIEINSYGQYQTEKELQSILSKLKNGAVIAYPTDSGYALGCLPSLKKPLDKIKKIRNLNEKHDFTLICRDLSEISQYAHIDTQSYRTIKKITPGMYTFILKATKQVPSIMLNKSKKTIGIRISDHYLVSSLLGAIGGPILSTTFILPDSLTPVVYPEDFLSKDCASLIDLVITGDYCGYEQTTVIDMSEDGIPKLLRAGGGDSLLFME